MNKIALITDTASDIPQAMQDKYNVSVFHFQIVYKDRTYKDQVEITSQEVLQTIDEEVPTTSLPSLEEMHNTFSRLEQAGYTQVVVVALSSGLSGCYNAVCMAKEDYPAMDIRVFDSKTLSIAQYMLVEEAAKAIERGLGLDAIIKHLEEVRAKQHTYFIVDELKYLIRGGRIGHVSGTVGKVLNLKPIMMVGDDGKYISRAKARGKNKALKTISEEAKQILENKKCKIYFIHAAAREDIEKVYHTLDGIPNIEDMQLWDWISPVACVHTGPGFMGMLIQEIE